MNRRIFIVAAGISLLLCIVTVGLWVRSYSRYDHIGYQFPPEELHIDESDLTIADVFHSTHVRSWSVLSLDGQLGIGAWELPRHWASSRSGFFRDSGRSSHASWSPKTPRQWLGVKYWHDEWSGRQVRQLAFSYWLVVAVLSVLPMCGVFHLMRRRRSVDALLCPTCGYDLRATPQRCPECGTVPPAEEARRPAGLVVRPTGGVSSGAFSRTAVRRCTSLRYPGSG